MIGSCIRIMELILSPPPNLRNSDARLSRSATYICSRTESAILTLLLTTFVFPFIWARHALKSKHERQGFLREDASSLSWSTGSWLPLGVAIFVYMPVFKYSSVVGRLGWWHTILFLRDFCCATLLRHAKCSCNKTRNKHGIKWYKRWFN